MSAAACSFKRPPADAYYDWDDRAVLCSQPVDDLTATKSIEVVEKSRMHKAAKDREVTFVHAHQPGITVSREQIDNVLTWADDEKLDYVTFDKLIPGSAPHAGLAFAFDDDDVQGWLSVRDILDAHNAKVTFFVTRWFEMSDDNKAGIAELAAEGHDIEPHTVHHFNAQTYSHDYGTEQYVSSEVVPSIQDLVDAGYHPTSFAYPFGAHDDGLDDMILDLPGIERVRTTLGECPAAGPADKDGEVD